jgi:hypothetical protein
LPPVLVSPDDGGDEKDNTRSERRSRSLKNEFELKRCDEIFDTLREQYIDTKVPENISFNAGVKSNLNVQGPNPYFILARFLV